ncbi:MAG: molecular chaperone [Acidiferrobacterales bacterium]
MVQQTTERSNVYGLLATAYRDVPTIELLRQIRDPAFLRALNDVGVRFDESFLGSPEEPLLAKLSCEYTRLFLGPGKHISPHESVHTLADGEGLWGKSTIQVQAFLESAGVEFRSGYHGLPDHISTELEFMQKITEAEAQAWKREACAEAMQWLAVEKEFVDQHLAQWVPGFCEKVIGDAESSFYREIAQLTRDFVALEKQEIERLGRRPLLQ